MENKIYKLTLADGTVIDQLRKNGDNYISTEELTEDMFQGNLFEITVESEDKKETYTNVDLVQITKMASEYWFVLRPLSDLEIQMDKVTSNIDFLAMMQDVEL